MTGKGTPSELASRPSQVDDPPPEGEAPSDVHGLPTTVRASAETSFDDWGSGLPVPPPAEAENSTWEDAPTIAPEDAADSPAFETVDDPRIPPGQDAFKIGEVAKIVGVKPYVLRYWENELAIIQPDKTSTRQRRYRREDVAMLLQVRRLRHDEKLSIARIRVLLGRSGDPARSGPLTDPTSQMVEVAPVTGSGINREDRAALTRELDEMRQAVLTLLEAVED